MLDKDSLQNYSTYVFKYYLTIFMIIFYLNIDLQYKFITASSIKIINLILIFILQFLKKFVLNSIKV